MLDENNGINKRFLELQREIAELRKKLELVNNEKEKWFKRKEELKKDIADSIKEAKELREEKEKINVEVKLYKENRDKQNSATKEKINWFKGLRKVVYAGEKGRSAEVLKSEIEKIQERIEREALKFSEEKKLMKIIGKMKLEYEKAKKDAVVSDDIKNTERDIKESKKEAEKLHLSVQELAAESKKKHDAYLELSKKIKLMNNEQEKSFDNFLKFKEEFNKASKEIDDKLDELRKVKDMLDNIKTKSKEKIEDAKKILLIKKAEDVEEKLKKGEKITTDDLIKFQGGRN